MGNKSKKLEVIRYRLQAPEFIQYQPQQKYDWSIITKCVWKNVACYYCCSVTQSCPILCDHGLQHSMLPYPSLSPRAYSNSCPLNQLYHLLSPSPPFFPNSRVFSSELALCIRWPKYWSFSISPSNEYSGVISFRIDWFDLLTVQGTLKSLLQHQTVWKHQCFGTQPFMVLLSHMYMTTGKTIALTKNAVFAITQMSVHIAALPAVT